jgi:uncharacterized protein (DUF2345 family)
MEVVLKDDKGKALPNKKYAAILPTGEIRQGTLDSQGKAKLQKTIPGKMKVKFNPK